MKVLKFGGTSVGSVNSILSVKKIVEAVEEPVIVVVSAFGGITDKLLTTSLLAAKGDVSYEKELSEIISRHLDIIEGVISDNECRVYVQKKAMELLDELSNILKGVYLINDLSPKTSDTIVSYGERLSSMIVANVINGSELFDSRKFIKTEIPEIYSIDRKYETEIPAELIENTGKIIRLYIDNDKLSMTTGRKIFNGTNNNLNGIIKIHDNNTKYTAYYGTNADKNIVEFVSNGSEIEYHQFFRVIF